MCYYPHNLSNKNEKYSKIKLWQHPTDRHCRRKIVTVEMKFISKIKEYILRNRLRNTDIQPKLNVCLFNG